MGRLPAGTVTFLFCDIEDSVGWWERQPTAMKDDVDRFTTVASDVMSRHGFVVKRTGDGFMAAFWTAPSALEAAVALRDQLAAAPLPFAVRMGMHSGAAEPTDGDYVGRTPNLAARVTDRAAGGQIVVSSTTADLVRRDLPDTTALSRLGEVTLRGIAEPEVLWEIIDHTTPGQPANDDRATSVEPESSRGPRFRFGSCVLNTATRELRVDDVDADLEPRTFAVLAYLLEHRDRVVPKSELLDEIWGDHFVGESALTTRIKHARSAVGDDGRAQSLIKTVHRVGYRFVAEVTEPVDHPQTSDAAPVPSPSSWSPTHSNALFGREADLAAVAARMAGHRMVTVTGPAGVGKSSLAERLLDAPLPAAPQHGWFCRLADTRDPDAVANVVLTALGESQQTDADPTESLLRVLEERADLVVLDNCEHLVGAAAELCRSILARCPAVHILATSRAPLDLVEESVYPLEPLDREAAVACFVERALDAGADLDPGDPALARLCAGLDGIPLALELAAARTRMLSPAEMVDLLDDRFRLLRATGADPGERSLHAAIAASWDGLSDADQDLLNRLGVFVGTFTLDDMREVAQPGGDPLDSVDALERLVRQSLVAAATLRGGRNRFRLLESVRDFAQERLGDSREIREAHVRHFVARAESLDGACQTEAVDDAVDELREVWVNLRAAVGYASTAGDAPSVRRILVAVAEYADVFGEYETLAWSAHADLDNVTDGDGPLGADALAVRARPLAHQGHLEEARELADRALSLHESHATLLTLVWCAYYTGDLDLVVESAPRLIEMSRSERGLDRGYAEGFAAIVLAVRQEADITSTPVSPADADRGVLGALDALTDGLRLCTVDPERAAELLEAVVEASIRHDYRLLLGAAASTLTQITLPARPPTEAMRVLQRTLARYRERSMWNLIAADIVMAARLLADEGDRETAARLIGARLAAGYASGLSEVLSVLLQDELEGSLGPQYAGLVEQGRRWKPPEAADCAISALARVVGDEDATSGPTT